MKKFVLLAGAVFLIVLAGCSCNTSQKKNDDTVKNQAKIAGISNMITTTLDNIPMDKAQIMIKEFKELGWDQLIPQKTNYYINPKMFRLMIQMLSNEKKAEGKVAHPIDGIRIYFIKDPNSMRGPSITFVSTRLDSTKWRNDTSKSVHQDYYEHDSSDPLFKLPSLSTEVFHDDNNGGAELYKRSIFTKKDCFWASDYVRRDTAEMMARSFAKGSKPRFNTYSVWYRLELFENIIMHTNSDAGLRIYIANHIKYQNNRNTFLIIPARWEAAKRRYRDQFSCDSVKEFMFTPANDNGELCPNHCN